MKYVEDFTYEQKYLEKKPMCMFFRRFDLISST